MPFRLHKVEHTEICFQLLFKAIRVEIAPIEVSSLDLVSVEKSVPCVLPLVLLFIPTPVNRSTTPRKILDISGELNIFLRQNLNSPDLICCARDGQ